MFDTTTINIMNRDFKITDWHVLKTLKWQKRLLKKATGIASGLVSDKKGMEAQDLQSAFNALFEDLTDDVFVEWVKDILEGVQIIIKDENGSVVYDGPVDLGNHFRGGNTKSLYLLMYEVLKWQLRDFLEGFQGLKEKFSGLFKKVMDKPESILEKMSIGKSGEL